jgi:uncharacterized protein
MKIGVLSDTHLGRVTRELKHIVTVRFKDADMILHAGDITSGGVLTYLETAGVTAVRGNMDDFDTHHLPVKRVITAGAFRIGLIHGYGSPDDLERRLRAEFEEIDCLVFGHSHQATNHRSGGILYFNPGSASSPRGPDGKTIGLLHLTEDGIRGEIIPID